MIPFLDLKNINQQYREELIAACTRVIDSGWYIGGKELEQFEQNFAEYCGVKFAIGVANGLDALILTLRAWKELGQLQEGDEVIVPSNTYIASILAITANKLMPVLVEPDLATYNIDPLKIEEAITAKTNNKQSSEKSCISCQTRGGIRSPLFEPSSHTSSLALPLSITILHFPFKQKAIC